MRGTGSEETREKAIAIVQAGGDMSDLEAGGGNRENAVTCQAQRRMGGQTWPLKGYRLADHLFISLTWTLLRVKRESSQLPWDKTNRTIWGKLGWRRGKERWALRV